MYLTQLIDEDEKSNGSRNFKTSHVQFAPYHVLFPVKDFLNYFEAFLVLSRLWIMDPDFRTHEIVLTKNTHFN